VTAAANLVTAHRTICGLLNLASFGDLTAVIAASRR
jgi:hypothetical protein